MDCNEENYQEMLQEIMQYKFALNELNLYLDTHPNDYRALAMHNDYSRKSKMLCDKFQKMYGPLTVNYPCNKWKWIESPWPWEKED